MLNIPRIMIHLIAHHMFDDVRNIRVELVYSVLLYNRRLFDEKIVILGFWRLAKFKKVVHFVLLLVP